MSWHNFYADRVGEGYTKYSATRYAPFIETVGHFVGHQGTYLEEGCGIATISKILARKNSTASLWCSDISPEMIGLARLNTIGIPNIQFLQASILDRIPGCSVDVCFSHGVHEHFCDSDIKMIVRLQKEKAKVVVHYVPTDGYGERSYGDERLLSVAKWTELVNPECIRTFNDGKDLILIT